jgi:hypothetical protein
LAILGNFNPRRTFKSNRNGFQTNPKLRQSIGILDCQLLKRSNPVLAAMESRIIHLRAGKRPWADMAILGNFSPQFTCNTALAFVSYGFVLVRARATLVLSSRAIITTAAFKTYPISPIHQHTRLLAYETLRACTGINLVENSTKTWRHRGAGPTWPF